MYLLLIHMMQNLHLTSPTVSLKPTDQTILISWQSTEGQSVWYYLLGEKVAL